jgi:hypothetical protein
MESDDNMQDVERYDSEIGGYDANIDDTNIDDTNIDGYNAKMEDARTPERNLLIPCSVENLEMHDDRRHTLETEYIDMEYDNNMQDVERYESYDSEMGGYDANLDDTNVDGYNANMEDARTPERVSLTPCSVPDYLDLAPPYDLGGAPRQQDYSSSTHSQDVSALEDLDQAFDKLNHYPAEWTHVERKPLPSNIVRHYHPTLSGKYLILSF